LTRAGDASARGPSSQPVVTAVVVAYMCDSDLAVCVQSLKDQSPRPDIIVVDNGRSDATRAWLRSSHPDVIEVRPDDNGGYVAGCNDGVSLVRTSHVLVMNPDTKMHTGALKEMLRVEAGSPGAFVTPKLLLPDGSINACGNKIHFTGITTCVGLNEPAESHSGIERPPLLSGAAILCRVASWRQLGGFDERFFMYLEDADLSLRARNAGYEILCAADAVVTHDYRLNMSPRKFFYLERNRYFTLAKNLDPATFVRLLPSLVLTQIAIAFYALLKGPRYLLTLLFVATDLLRNKEALSVPPVSRGVLFGADALSFQELVPIQLAGRLLERLTTPLFQLARPRKRIR
jgi:GT2 family glycosyltransferase